MRVVNLRDDVIYPIADLRGIERGSSGELAIELARPIVSAINSRCRRIWPLWDWPDLRVTEERAFRPIWNSTEQFAVGDELFYIPGWRYYAVLEDAPGDPPVGTLPTNTTYFEPIELEEYYISRDQRCRRAIGEVLGVYGSNPRTNSASVARRLPFRISQHGIDVYGGGSMTAWIEFKVRPSKFSAEPYDAATAYAKGDVMYWPEDGNCYRAVTATTGNEPESVYWAQVPMPEVLAEYVKWGAAGDTAENPVDRREWQEQAERAFQTEADSLIAQGQDMRYQHFGCRSQVCLQGLNWFIASGWYDGSATTSLTDACQDEGGAGVTVEPVGAQLEAGITDLVLDQAYIDVAFATAKTTSAWQFLTLHVENTVDDPQLYISADQLVSRTTDGFRIVLSQAPDSGNYKLRWRVAVI